MNDLFIDEHVFISCGCVVMSERIKESDLDTLEEEINETLEACESDRRIKIGRRYGYKGIDLYDVKGSQVKTLITGIGAKQAYTYLRGMSDALYISKCKVK